MDLYLHETDTDSLNLDMDYCHNQVAVSRWQGQQQLDALDSVAAEVPVALVYNGISHVGMMCSPADLKDFALGFSLSEGIVQRPEEIYETGLVAAEPADLSAGVEIRMAITTQRSVQLKQRHRNLAGRTGCGLCGAQSLQHAVRPIQPVPVLPPPTPKAVETAVQQLVDKQPLQRLTGAFHGAAWCNSEGDIQVLREDIGRHNALDKLIGALKTADSIIDEGFVLVSSRASYEMVHKTSSCGISSLVAVSAPTGLALNLAKQAGLNIVGFARPGRHVIYNQSEMGQEK
jgi:FdhD protein